VIISVCIIVRVFFISKINRVYNLSVPASERRVAEIHSSRESGHSLVVVHFSRLLGVAGVVRSRSMFDGLSRLRNSNRSERCEARGGRIDGVAKSRLLFWMLSL